MQSKKRKRLAHIILLMACAGLLAVALGGCGIAHGPYGHMNHGYDYRGAPGYNGNYSGWGPRPTRYHDPSGMNMYPDFRRDSRYYP